MLAAERDRGFLKQQRKHREYEAELMKDVPGWEVGTWFGQHAFRAQDDEGKELLRQQRFEDYYIFAKPSHYRSEKYYREMKVL